MSFIRTGIIPVNPTTERGTSTKLSSSKDKVVYANGKCIIIRDLTNPLASVVYSGHVHNTTVATISPTGYYCASGDVNGNVKVWDTIGEENILKGEYKVISGRINDIAWDGESKRIIAGGAGRERFGHVFLMDTGSSTGVISGHSKAINAVSFRHQRPFRAVTSSDDNSVILYHGAPYRFAKSIKTHTKFVNDVKYAPSGDIFASVGSDSKIFLYEGKSGDVLGEITDSSHKGTIYACSWSPDSKNLITSSGDRTVKLWDVESKKATTTWTVGPTVNDQQLGNTWSGESNIVSLSLSGALNIFDPRVGDKAARVISAPQKSITCLSPTPSTSGTFLTGCADGRVFSCDIKSGEDTPLEGDCHTNLVVAMAASPTSETVYSTGFDDKVREIKVGGETNFVPASISTISQPKSLAVSRDDYVFLVEIGTIEVIKSNQKVTDVKVAYEPSAVAVSSKGDVAVGEDRKVHLFQWDGKILKESAVLASNNGVVTALSYSPDGTMLASGDSSGKVALYSAIDNSLITSRWTFHSARINSIAWTSDSKHCASGSLDTHVYIWSVAKPLKNIAMRNVGPGGVNGVAWLAEGKLATVSADGCARLWDVTFHPA